MGASARALENRAVVSVCECEPLIFIALFIVKDK